MAAREEEEDGKDMKAKDVMEEVKVVWRTWRREEAERDGGWKLWQEVIDKRYARIMPVCIIITLANSTGSTFARTRNSETFLL